MHAEDRICFKEIIMGYIVVFVLVISCCCALPAGESVFGNAEASERFGAPLIIPSELDITLDVGINYTLKCRSKNPVTWRIPEIYSSILYEIVPFELPESSLPYGSSLHLQNVQVENVGKYYCVEVRSNQTQDSDLDILITLYQAETIYIYVNDTQKLLVPTNMAVMAAQYADVIIPCKPSSKDVKVELLREDEANSNDVASYDSSYDPMIGFKVNNTKEGESFHCVLEHKQFPQHKEEHIFILVVQPHTDFINKPIIHSKTKGHAIQGEKLILDCSVDVSPSVQFAINWTLPNNNAAFKEGRAEITNSTKEINPNSTVSEIGRNQLIVNNVSEKDDGYYKCDVMDHSGNKNWEKFAVKILRQDESYINMNEQSNHYRIEESIKRRRANMRIKYKAYPQPTFIWFNNMGKEIKSDGEKYEITQTADSVQLQIRNIQLEDTGDYIIKASNGQIEKELKFELYVRDKPSVQMKEVYYVQVGQDVNLACDCASFPKSQITWTWIPCQIKPQWPSCFPTSAKNFEFKEVIVPEDTDQLEELEVNSYRTEEKSILMQQSELRFTPTQPGFVRCSAKNSEGNDTFESAILLSDLMESFTILGVNDDDRIAAGDDVTLTCGALAYNYSGNIDWYKNDRILESSPDLNISNLQTEYSYRKLLKLKNISKDKSGIYECRAAVINDNDGPDSRTINITVHTPIPPTITHSNLDGSKIGTKLGESLNLTCNYNGLPEPKITWFKEDTILSTNRNSTLHIPFVKPENEGVYKCVVSNRLGSVERSSPVTISNLPGLHLPAILSIIGLFIILILLIIYLCIRFFREKKLRKELKAAGLANFEDGAVECINPALSLDEQADLLPYDRRFEFPKDKLKLGKQLGAGAFGVVLKAIAEGIIPEEKDTTVAVKMVKKTADNEVMRALVSELKIMVHLGQHLNVVNLLGAITKNIAKREVMLIVEYCRYGNVQNFLLKNRKNFINQIDPKTDRIDQTIITKEMRFSGDYDYNSQGLKYAKLTFPHAHLNNNSKSKRDTGNDYVRQSDMDYMGANVNSATTQMTTIPGDEGIILSNNSIQPAWRSNYKPDGALNMDINTTHLVAWAFQVARGMDYLASRKVLHGDLAARNILLCDDNVVKICDFGLARSMYRSDNYKKHGEAPLPIKWLALESMSDQIFSTHSDIWSYGIVLWEFFSLAKVPYPGMDADETLYRKLKDGYRMEKPEYANREIYDIMLECWSTNPEMRPPFNDLERRFAKMLEDDVKNHYVDLNDPYLKMNSEYFKDGKTDYLAMMGCPEEPAPQAPRYVNGKLISDMVTNASTDPDYVQMNPKQGPSIFSPRGDDDYVRNEHFKFPPPMSPTISNNLDSPSTKNRKKGVIPEEVPMLNRNTTGSDSETELSPDAISSPSKQFASLNKSSDPMSTDNYANVNNSDANKLRTKDAFSNPEYLMLNVNEKRK